MMQTAKACIFICFETSLRQLYATGYAYCWRSAQSLQMR